jgi:uroporphyrinogen decarboxylase
VNSRARVQASLNHSEPDHIPFDLGSTVVTGIHVQAYRRLRSYLGLPPVEPRIVDVFQQIVAMDDDLRERLKVDALDVAPRSSALFKIGIRDDMPGYRYFYDEWGIGWRMPVEDGFYFDMFHHPFKPATTLQEIDDYAWPDPVDPARFVGLRERARQTAEVQEKACVLGGLSGGFMELTAWLRGFQDYYADYAGNEEFLTHLMDKIIALKMAYWDRALAEAGPYADVVVEADDFAAQFNMLISPAAYRRVGKPRHRKLFDFIKARSQAKIFFHSCGAIRPIIPDLIEAGVDILNPVQVSARGMDSAELKREYGKDLTFWGGGVDTQNVLGTGTPQQVRDDTRRRITDLAAGGGFIFAAVHNIQANVPAENIMAMWETLQEFGAC